jgi:hypothetical protein
MAIGSGLRNRNDEPEGRGCLFWIGIVVLFLAVIGPLTLWGSLQVRRLLLPPAQRALEDRQAAVQEAAADQAQAAKEASDAEGHWESMSIALAKDRMVRALKDPDSAHFGNAWVEQKASYDPKVMGIVCGQVNAKNSFGGYTGLKDFIVIAGIPLEEGTSSAFNKLWNEHCVIKTKRRRR